MIVVTGAAGFIGSCLVSHLLEAGYRHVVAVDDFYKDPEKHHNLEGKALQEYVERDNFFYWLDQNHTRVRFIFHIGARTDTAEFDEALFERLNVNYSKEVWRACARYEIPLVYASSAATYGLGELGYEDSEKLVGELKPLNAYGRSKNEFDRWMLHVPEKPPRYYGLKFFNVYGPNEYHKGRMASVIWHAFRQISETGGMKLFRSHDPRFEDGHQARDFIYIKDILSICQFLMEEKPASGLYNCGTGMARTFLDLVRTTFRAMGREENITFIDTPEDIRDKYQYFTEASMAKLRKAGYLKTFHSLEQGVTEYVQSYLLPGAYY